MGLRISDFGLRNFTSMNGHLLYADSAEEAERLIAGLPPGEPVALFSREAITPPERAIFYRQRAERNPKADLAAAKAAFPGIAWREPASPGAPVRSPFPPVATATLRDRRPLRIEAIAVAVGGPVAAREFLEFIETYRHFHPEVPVYVLTDEATAAELDRSGILGGNPLDVYDTVGSDYLAAIADDAKDVAKPFGDQWPIHWLALKLEALQRAIAAFPSRGVLLVDCDLIFTRRLPALAWEADLVLSEHHGPLPDRLPPKSGIYNAGMVLCRDARIVERWRELFHQGVGGFYEQGCLEQLAREFLTDTFPGSWNWGNWRRTEDLESSGRTPAILHHHLGTRREIPHREEATRGLDHVALRAIAEIRIAKKHPDKIAILHHAKAAGSSLSAMLEEAAVRGGWQHLDTYRAPLRWRRDWTPAELDGIASGQMLGLHGRRHIVHNHACGWPADTVKRWIGEGWVFVSTYRPIRDRLCSFFYWNQRARILTGPVAKCETLDEFLRVFLSDERYRVDFAPHPCDELVQHWATIHDLPELVETVTGLFVGNRVENTSRGGGWDHECEGNVIAKGTQSLVNKHPAVKAWDKFAKARGFER